MANKIEQRTWLTNARIKMNLTQEQVGDKLGIAANTVSDHELGKRNPKPRTAIGYIRILRLKKYGITFEDFYRA